MQSSYPGQSNGNPMGVGYRKHFNSFWVTTATNGKARRVRTFEQRNDFKFHPRLEQDLKAVYGLATTVLIFQNRD